MRTPRLKSRRAARAPYRTTTLAGSIYITPVNVSCSNLKSPTAGASLPKQRAFTENQRNHKPILCAGAKDHVSVVRGVRINKSRFAIGCTIPSTPLFFHSPTIAEKRWGDFNSITVSCLPSLYESRFNRGRESCFTLDHQLFK